MAQSDGSGEDAEASETIPSSESQGYTPSALEQRIAESNPCSGLSIDVGGIGYGVDRIKRVNLQSADLELDGDGFTFAVDGRLVCFRVGESGEESLEFDLSANLEGLLSECRVTAIDVNLDNASGDLAWLVSAASPIIDGLLTNTVRDRAEEACRQL